MKHFLLTGIAITAMAFAACNDETLDVGNSLTQTSDKLTISPAEYDVETRTVLADSILMRSAYCYLGKVKDPETGAYVKSEFMTQFNVLETFDLPEESTIATPVDGKAIADSCQLELYLSSPSSVTDTMAALKISVAELERPMEEARQYYSNFNPQGEGFIRQDGLRATKMFSYNDPTVNKDILDGSGFYSVVKVKLNQPYTDRSGTTYNNYGSYIMQQYYQHPEYFKNSYTFIHNVCPGIYVSVADGEGVFAEIPALCLRLYFQVAVTSDSIVTYGTALAGTEEILQTTMITNEQEVLRRLAADNSCTYIKAPAGLFTEATLPVDDIMTGHENDSLLTATVSFQRINSVTGDTAQPIPPYLLMVPKDSLYTFFENQKTPDNQTTFYTSYLNSSNLNVSNQYTYSNISSLITTLATQKKNGLAADPAWLSKHPDWNKVLLVPIRLVKASASSTVVSGYEHYIDVATTKLVGGSENPYDPIKLSVVYGKFQ